MTTRQKKNCTNDRGKQKNSVKMYNDYELMADFETRRSPIMRYNKKLCYCRGTTRCTC